MRHRREQRQTQNCKQREKAGRSNQLLNNMHNCIIRFHFDCAKSHVHPQNICACRTMHSPPARATIAACGCNKSGGRQLTPTPKSDRQRELGGVAKSTGERALQHSTLLYLPLLVPPFPLSSGARHLLGGGTSFLLYQVASLYYASTS